MLFGSVNSSTTDKVIATYNVYLSPGLSNEMHVFQYPLRQKNRPYESNKTKLFYTDGIQKESAESSSLINSGSRLRMSLELDTFGSSSFSAKPSEEHGHRHFYHLHSKPFQPRSNYVVAYIDSNGFHFSPVSTVQQFTPLLGEGFQHVGPSSGSADEKLHSDPSRSLNEQSLDRSQRDLLRQRSDMLSRDDSTMKEIKVFGIESPETVLLRSQLSSPTLEAIDSAIPKASVEHIENCLFPPEIYCGKGDDSTIVRRFSSHYTLEQRIRELMLRCQILPYHLIFSTISCSQETVAEKDVIAVLLKISFFMHGVWVSFSCPHFKGVEDSLRGVILGHFFMSPTGNVSRAELNRLVSTSQLRRSIKDILQAIASLNTEEPDPSKRFWKLNFCADLEGSQREFQRICSFSPAEAQKQQASLNQAFSKCDVHANLINSGRASSIFAGISGVEVGSREAGKQLRADTRLSPHQETIVEEISRNIRQIFMKEPVLLKESLKTKVLEERRLRYPTATAQMMQMAMQATSQQFTSNTWILKNTGDALVDQYRPAIVKSILSLHTFTLQQLTEALTRDYPNETVPERVVQQVAREVAQYSAAETKFIIRTGMNSTPY